VAGVASPTIQATTTTEFCWLNPKDVFWISGPIHDLDVYGTDFQQALPAAVCLVDPNPAPPVGQGRYYLVREDCPAGSWQTQLGVERDRDRTLP